MHSNQNHPAPSDQEYISANNGALHSEVADTPPVNYFQPSSSGLGNEAPAEAVPTGSTGINQMANLKGAPPSNFQKNENSEQGQQYSVLASSNQTYFNPPRNQQINNHDTPANLDSTSGTNS